MKTEFFTPQELGEIIKNGDVDTLISEIDRLSNIVKNYEVVLEQTQSRFNSSAYKTPNYKNY